VLSFKNLLKKIYFFIVKIFFDSLYGHLYPNQNNILENINLTKIKFSQDSHKEYEIYEINDARIYTDLSQNVAVIKDKKIYDKLSIQLENNKLVEVYKNNVLKTGTRRFLQKKINGNILSLVQGIPGIDNYGHWLLDIIPKLIITRKYISLNNFDAILFPNIKKEFQRTTIRYFNIPENKVIDGSKIRHLYAKKITIPAHPYWELNRHQLDTVANVDQDILFSIREIFLKKKEDNFNNSQKIYIDRSDSKFDHNQLSNNEEVCNHLKKMGFAIIKLTKFTLEEQIKVFNNAKIVIANHGAGLTNIIFCNPKTKIVEIENPNFKCDVFKNISRLLNLNYKKIEGEVNIFNKGDVKIKLKDLEL